MKTCMSFTVSDEFLMLTETLQCIEVSENHLKGKLINESQWS